MNKKSVLDDMSIRELRDAIYAKEQQAAIDKYGAKKEVPFNIEEVKSLRSDSSGSLYRVRIEDGCEGWEALVEIDRTVGSGDWHGDSEELVNDHILNFVLDNDYYEPGDIESIDVEEICRYTRPIFLIK